MAQQTTRIELPPPGSSESYKTVPLGEKGVLLISKPTKNSYNVQKFDTNLEKSWSIDGPIEANLDYVTCTYDGQSVFLLFSRYRSSIYQIVKVNIGPGFVESFIINTVDRFQITEFKSLGYSLFLAGTVREQPVLIHADLFSSQTKVLPPATKSTHVIQSIDVDREQRLINVSFSVRKGRQTSLLVHSYSEVGKLLSPISVTPEKDFSLLNGRLQMLNDSVKLIIGTYGYQNMQSTSSTASQGLFIARFVNDEVSFMRYHSFTDFRNFFGYLSERQKEKMERRIQKKKEEGNDLRLNYRLLIHDIIPKGNQYMMVAEVFYPEYRSPNPSLTPASYLGNPWTYGTPFGTGLYNPWYWNPLYSVGNTYNQQIFDGFVYTHAVVAGFDQDGKLVWDNSFNFDHVKSMELHEKINVELKEDGQTRLVYSKEGAIHSKIIRGETVISDGKSTPLGTSFEGDKVRKTSTDAISFWFDHFYLAWGEQKITNASESDAQNRGKRTIFYLTKITF